MKRIIVACDGTGQSASRGKHSIATNVRRFCHALANSSKPHHDDQQIVFYQSGVGTQDLGVGWGMGKLAQKALGEGLDVNVADGYTFIMNNYQPGDKLFIFGFSRGAFTARVLANIVARLGIIKKRYSWALKDALEKYKAGELDQFEVEKKKPDEDETWGPTNGDFTPRAYEVEIEVVGCWDTVASLGVPWKPVTNAGGVSGKYEHYDGSLVKGIKRAFHALALDECRGPFTPTLWYLPKDPAVAKTIDLQQCWFPGVHSNVGGGYRDRALANLALAWMIDRCRDFLDFDSEYIKLIANADQHPEDWHRNRKDNKDKTADEKQDFDEHYQGWGRGMWYDSYWEGDTWTWKYRTPRAYAGGETNETMHASVRERWQTSREEGLRTGPAVWNPEALKGFEPREGADGVWEWVKKGSKGKEALVIREAPFPSFSEHLEAAETNVSFEGLLRYPPVGVFVSGPFDNEAPAQVHRDIVMSTKVYKVDEAVPSGDNDITS